MIPLISSSLKNILGIIVGIFACLVIRIVLCLPQYKGVSKGENVNLSREADKNKTISTMIILGSGLNGIDPFF